MPYIKEVDDIESSELKIFSKYSENQLKHIYEPERGVFIAESPKVILRALEAGYMPESVLVEKGHIMGEAREVLERILQVADKPSSISIYTAEEEILKNITGYYMVRGLLAVMRRKELPALEKICRKAERVAVLEDIVNPTNIGAIFRSAAALGIDGVLLTPNCADPLYRRAVRVSMGTVFQIAWTYFDRNAETDGNYLERMHQMGFQIAAMALDENSISIDSPKLKGIEKLAIVLGAEGDGLRKESIQESDFTVKIPMHQQVDSLNVAAASAVAFWVLGKGQGQD